MNGSKRPRFTGVALRTFPRFSKHKKPRQLKPKRALIKPRLGGSIYGVVQNESADEICLFGLTKIVLAETVKAGNYLATNSRGRFIRHRQKFKKVAIALGNGHRGQIITAMLNLGAPQLIS